MLGAAGAGVVLILVIGFLLLRGHGSPSGPSGPPQTIIYQGSFTKGTMVCPPATSAVPGDTCLIKIDLPAGKTHIEVTWNGPALVAMGVRGPLPNGKDVGPQTTGEKGKDTFDTPTLEAGTYELRVVEVTKPGPFNFTVSVNTPG